eukprot:Amastigsp_a508488_819.p3 type:complete len:104 gc:universal Amastigsp_a508488_819:368-679(+)
MSANGSCIAWLSRTRWRPCGSRSRCGTRTSRATSPSTRSSRCLQSTSAHTSCPLTRRPRSSHARSLQSARRPRRTPSTWPSSRPRSARSTKASTRTSRSTGTT